MTLSFLGTTSTWAGGLITFWPSVTMEMAFLPLTISLVKGIILLFSSDDFLNKCQLALATG